MKKQEIFKRGMKSASESYHRKFDYLSEELKNSVSKQAQANERNHELQKKLIDNEERLDKDLDKIYSLLGEERTPGTFGNATLSTVSSNNIISYTNGALNKYNLLSNIGELKVNAHVVDAVADFLTTAVEKDMNKKFHQNLTVLEQNGIITEEKFAEHVNKVAMAKQLTGIGVYAVFSLAPVICNTIQNYSSKKDVSDFIIGAYAYINRDLTPMISFSIKQVLLQMNISIKEEKLTSVFEQKVNKSDMSGIPMLSKRNREVFNYKGMDLLAKEIVSRCDLNNDKIYERSLEFVEGFLGINHYKAKELIADAMYSQESLSDITWFSAINLRYVFLDFISSVQEARRFAVYDLENDPFRKIRLEREQKMENIINDVSSRKNLFLTAGKRKDIIDASAKMLQYSLNPDYSIATDIKMIKREKEILDLYGLR